MSHWVSFFRGQQQMGAVIFLFPRSEASRLQPRSQLMVFVNKVLLDRAMPIHLSIADVSGTKLNGCRGNCVTHKHIYHLALNRKSAPTPVSQDEEPKFGYA